MSKPRHPNRYVVYHSFCGEHFFDTLKEAREYVKYLEWHYPQYSPSIYDTLKERHVL